MFYSLIFCGLLAVSSGQIVSQIALDTMAANLDIRYHVVTNLKEENVNQVEITLINHSPNVNLDNELWHIRFFSIYPVAPGLLDLINTRSVELPGQGVRVSHIQGSLYSMEPTQDFVTLWPGTQRKIKLKVSYSSVARTDVMGNWYLLVDGLAPRVINSTTDLAFVTDKTRVEQWKRSKDDQYNPYTPQERYERNFIPSKSANSAIRIIPTPLVQTVSSDSSRTIFIDNNWILSYSPDLQNEARYILGQLGLTQQSTTPFDAVKVIQITTGQVDLPNGTDFLRNSPDAYSLSVNSTREQVTIIGQGPSGVFNAFSTLLSLRDNQHRIPESSILDAPRFEHRGVLLDIARNFHDANEIVEVLQVMSMYKLNKLQLHLSDDEGWRLQITNLPELTQLGARRCHDDSESQCLFPQLGSGPDASLPGSGYLTSEDYRRILLEAQRRHIQVIPEFDMPGHARAAIRAMEHRNQLLVNAQRPQDGAAFRLVEENDPSQYVSTQYFTDNALNPCLPSSYTFISVIMDELVSLHRDIQPLTRYHFGGDEVAEGAWVNSSTCNTLLQNVPNITPKEYFFQQVSAEAKKRSLSLGAWKSGLMEKGSIKPYTLSNLQHPTVYSYTWDREWEANTSARSYTFANEGYKVVLVHSSYLFFDHPYEPDPEERGYYWAARFEDTQKMFSFNAHNVYDNIKEWSSGKRITDEERCGENGQWCPQLRNPENIAGMQASLFSETTRTREQMHERLFPRMLAVAERAWHLAQWEKMSDSKEKERMLKEDWYSFAHSVGRRELMRLEQAGIQYRIPPPGAVVKRNGLLSTALYPGLTVEYSKNAGLSWQATTPVTALDDYNDRIWLRTRSMAGNRYSRTVVLRQEPQVPFTTQPQIDYIADHVLVMYTVHDNFKSYPGESLYKASITLTNNENTTITTGNWEIYFVNSFWIEPDLLQEGERYVDYQSWMYIEHVKGYLFKLGPTSRFKDLEGYDSVTLHFRGSPWMIARTDIMPNWYVTAPGMAAVNIKDTEDESLSFVSPFDTPDKWKRTEDDKFDPWTPASRYDRNKNFLVSKTPSLPVLPTPRNQESSSGSVDLMAGQWAIEHSKFNATSTTSSEDTANYLAEMLRIFLPEINIVVKASGQGSQQARTISLKFEAFTEGRRNHEMYKVKVDSARNNIQVVSPTEAGIFYGAVSIIQLAQAGQDGKVTAVELVDFPRFPHRGMHVDVARNFIAKTTILKLLNVMALYKLNKFHFHLTDDEAWRLEIPGLPELTAIGGRRCHDLREEECVMSTLGSGATSQGNSGSGFFTVDEYLEILRYAKQRHIEVIPEFDFPGHSHAAIKAMRARRQTLLDLGYTSAADDYLLDELNDPSLYWSIQRYDDNAVNPCMESTYRFIAKIVEEVKAMHQPIQPLRVFHFGGDEVAEGTWVDSEACRPVLETGIHLKEHFTRRVAQLTRDLTLSAWEDGLMDHGNVPWNRSLIPNEEVLSQAWQNVWEWGHGMRPYALANAGYKVVLSPVTHTYFDFPQEPDPEERGSYWGTRYTDAFKTFSFLPDDFYRNIDITRFGNPISKEDVCKDDNSGCPPLDKPENIIGMQGQLWSEAIRYESAFEYNVFPRLLALAERAWHKASWEDKTGKEHTTGKVEDFSKFATALGSNHLRLLDQLEVMYRVPPPGARQSGETIMANVEFPGLTIQYQVKGTQSWNTWKPDSQFTLPSTVHLRSVSSDGKRFSRQITVAMLKPSEPDSAPIFTLSTMLCILVAMAHMILRL